MIRKTCPWIAALAGGAFYVLAPLTQSTSSAIMADGLVALLDLWAMIFLVRYLQTEETKKAVLFGLFAALSMATKANGSALVLLPVIALALTGRWRLLRARGLYYAGAIILVLGVPWQLISYYLIARSQGNVPVNAAIMLDTSLGYLNVLWRALGWGIVPFSLLGAAITLKSVSRREGHVTQTGALALFCSVLLFHIVIGNGDTRYMLAALPPALILGATGFVWLVRHVPLRSVPVSVRAAALGTGACALFATQTWRLPHKPYQGFDQVAHFLETSDPSEANYVVVSHARGEGAFISEMAMHDRRPGHVILRSSKVLSTQTWYGSLFRLKYDNPQAIRQFLDAAPIDAVVLDTRPPQNNGEENACGLERLTLEALEGDTHWTLRNEFPQIAGTQPWIKLYRRVGERPAGSVGLDMRYTLGKDVVQSAPSVQEK